MSITSISLIDLIQPSDVFRYLLIKLYIDLTLYVNPKFVPLSQITALLSRNYGKVFRPFSP